MEKGGGRGLPCRPAVCGVVVLLCATAFSCSLAAEFRKVKVSSHSSAPAVASDSGSRDLNRVSVGWSIRIRT
jgi:hypothetical protein